MSEDYAGRSAPPDRPPEAAARGAGATVAARHRAGGSRLAARIPVYVFCAVVPAAFSLLLWSWYSRVDQARFHLSGLYQADMPTYLCNARVAIRSPTLISYASPWDLRVEPRALLVQWPISLLGALVAVGLSPAQAEGLLRLGGGFVMFVLLARIIAVVVQQRVLFWSALLSMSLGGGVAWLWAWSHGSNLDRMRGAIRTIQAGYYWWCVELFRNLSYPLELVQHCSVFAYLLALMHGRFRLAVGLLAVAASTSPFVAVMVFGVHGLVSVVKFRRHYREHIAALVIAGLFVFQYKVLMAGDPVLGAVMSQHQRSTRYNDPMSWLDTLTGYGFVLLIVPVLLLDWGFCKRVLQSRALWPLLAMSAWSMLLIHHSRIPQLTPMMPKHFTRGYAFVGMGILGFAWLQDVALRWPRAARAATLAGVLFVPLSLPDNIAFSLDQYHFPPDPPLLLWPNTTEQLLAHLRSRPDRMRILSDDPTVSRQVCAMTDHLTMVATGLVTPEFDRRLASIRRFLNEPADEAALGDWRVDAVLLPAGRSKTARKLTESGRWRLSFQNVAWGLFVRTR